MAESFKTISFVKGKGNLNHNNRVYIAKNVDGGRTKNNVIFKQEKLEVAYGKCFGKAIEEYNQKQKRSDRKKTIESYMDEIKKNQKKNGSEKIFYEQLVQVGDMHDSGYNSSPEEAKKCEKILIEYVKNFQARNPNLYVFNAVLHTDEQTAHVHLSYLPVASQNYKQGLRCRNSLMRALSEQGIEKGEGNKQSNYFTNWRKREIKEIEKICVKYGVEIRCLNSEKRSYLTPDQIREAGRLADKQVEVLKRNGKLFTEEQLKAAVKLEIEKITQSQEPKKVPEEKIVPVVTPVIESEENIYTREEIWELWEKYHGLEEEQQKYEKILADGKLQIERLRAGAKKAARESWNIFKSDKQERDDYLKKHNAAAVVRQTKQAEAELRRIEKELEEINKKIKYAEEHKKLQPKAKLAKTEAQKQRQQERENNKGGGRVR